MRGRKGERKGVDVRGKERRGGRGNGGGERWLSCTVCSLRLTLFFF